MMELYLIRHPQTVGGEILKGHLDVMPRPGWEADVDTLARKLANQGSFDAFFSSTLKRSQLPADMIVDYLRTTQRESIDFMPLELLIERGVGVLQGMRYGDIDTNGKSLGEYVFEKENIPGGESKSHIIRRTEMFSEIYLQKYIDDGGNVGIIGHGWWINYLINSLLHESRPFNNMQNLEMVHLSINGKNVEEK